MDILHILSQYFLPFIVILSVLVFVHELGHYLVARWCGVRVEVFSIGFGHEIYGYTDSHGTRWKFGWLPLGGYVQMYGDRDPASMPDIAAQTQMTDAEKSVAFFSQSVGKRAAIVAAGPAINFIFAIFVLIGLFMVAGRPTTPPVAGAIMPDSAAASAGILADDRILSIDGQSVQRFEDIQRIITLNSGKEVALQIQRGQQELQIKLTPRITEVTDNFGNTHRVARLGLAAKGGEQEFVRMSLAQAVPASMIETWNVTTGTLKAVWQIISGFRSAEELGGPLRIAQMSGKTQEQGAASLFWFLAVLSINLGLINLFPVPLLDGGHLVMYGAEALRGKSVSERTQEFAARIGFACLITLMLFTTFNDLQQLRVFAYFKDLLFS